MPGGKALCHMLERDIDAIAPTRFEGLGALMTLPMRQVEKTVADTCCCAIRRDIGQSHCNHRHLPVALEYQIETRFAGDFQSGLENRCFVDEASSVVFALVDWLVTRRCIGAPFAGSEANAKRRGDMLWFRGSVVWLVG